jgi:hypothetical protein
VSFRPHGSNFPQPSRSRGTVFFAALLAGGLLVPAAARAQANEQPPPVQDQAFDCVAFKQAIAAAGDGFAALRGARKSDSDSVAISEVNAPLIGACQIVDKKKINETSFSCESGKMNIADAKATVEACLGDAAKGLASNENPNTPYLRYTVQIDGVKARVIVLNTFGKTTLAIFTQK